MNGEKGIRVSVKALIISDGCLLVMQARDAQRDWYLLPGGSAHQLELMFECRVPDGYSPRQGSAPDPNQVGTVWLPLADLESGRIYPADLKRLLKNGLPAGGSAYLGDIN